MKNTLVSVEDCPSGHHYYCNVKLVRGVGKRSVRVIMGLFHWQDQLDEDSLAIRAAKLASKNGWRKIIVSRDSYEGDTIRGFNLHQYHHEQWQNGFIGAFLGFTEGN
jgi:hypothetical protein